MTEQYNYNYNDNMLDNKARSCSRVNEPRLKPVDVSKVEVKNNKI